MFLEEDPHDVRGTFNIAALCAMYHCKIDSHDVKEYIECP